MPTVRRPAMEMQLDALDYANALPFVRYQDEVSLVVVDRARTAAPSPRLRRADALEQSGHPMVLVPVLKDLESPVVTRDHPTAVE